MQAKLILAAGKEYAVTNHHPWIFAGAVDSYEGKVFSGATVMVYAHNGRCLGRAAYSPESQIRARMWTWNETESIDHAFFKNRIAKALEHRKKWVHHTQAIRLIFGEADNLPGLVVDQYQDVLACQFLSAGAEHWKEKIVDVLMELTGCHCVVERSDASVRVREGLPLTSGVMRGALPAEEIVAIENGISYLINPLKGHKTGFYVDQRDNRKMVADLARDKRVLNMFCYTGGFSLAALQGGAREVISVDSSGEALQIAQRQVTINQLDPQKAIWLDQDAFNTLKDFRVKSEEFDMIILDPPKFAPSAQHLLRAKKAYKEINRTAMQMLRPGGLLFTFSCSGAMDVDTFEKTVSEASREAATHLKDPRFDYRILKRLTSGLDHPKLTSFPEGDYLKGLLLERV